MTSLFTVGSYLYLYDVEFGNTYQYASFLINGVDFNGTDTRITLADGSVNAAEAYVGDLSYFRTNATFGGDKTIPGNYSHTEGQNTIALGLSSHAEGESAQAVGIGSHAEGYNTQAVGNYQHVQGTFNLPLTSPSAFILGNGTDDANRSNLIFAAGSEVQITGSLNVTQGITGDLTGTASFATNASNAGTAATASYVLNAVSASFATTASFTPQVYRIVNNTDSAVVSGTTVLTLIYSQLIPANTFATGDIVRISWRGQKTNFNGSNNAFIYINTSSTVTGATLLGSWSTTANPRMEQMDRKLYIKNATTNTEVYNVTANSAGEYTNTGTSAFANIAINWTVNQYIIAANSLGSALDTFKGSSYEIERIRTT